MRLFLCVSSVLIGGLIFAIPNMTRRELLFAIPVSPGFRDGSVGRRAVLMFRAIVAAVTLVVTSALLLLPNQFPETIATLVPMAIVLAGGLGFYWQNRRLSPFAVQFALRRREVELTALPERLPRFTWLAIGPFLVLIAAATWLFFNWQRIPERLPVRFDLNGQSNAWEERTAREVYGPLLLGAGFCAWILITALASWFGSRRLRSRSVLFGCLIAAQYLSGVLFALVPLQQVLGFPLWVIALLLIAFVVPTLTIAKKKLSEPSAALDSTPNECWKAGIFYYNPNDAALVVEKRDGLGYSFNFANRWSWMLVIGLVLLAAVPWLRKY